MAITIPVIFTEMLESEVKYKRSTTEETMRKFVQNINFLGALSPIGCVRSIQLNQTGVQIPDENIWQIMDGSEILNPNSPLRSMGLIQRFTPDMTGKYIKGATSLSLNPIGGSPTIDLSHTHSTSSVSGEIRGEEGDEKTARVAHSHGIDTDFTTTEPLEVAHQKLAFYIKIT